MRGYRITDEQGQVPAIPTSHGRWYSLMVD